MCRPKGRRYVQIRTLPRYVFALWPSLRTVRRLLLSLIPSTAVIAFGPPSPRFTAGVFTLTENIPANRKVMEYRGEKIGPREAKRRGKTPYLFVLDDYWTLDGGVGGSGAELVNHSCQPNLVSRIMKGHIIYMSLRAIRKGEELTIDYNYDDTDETMRCLCGHQNCRGIINRND